MLKFKIQKHGLGCYENRRGRHNKHNKLFSIEIELKASRL